MTFVRETINGCFYRLWAIATPEWTKGECTIRLGPYQLHSESRMEFLVPINFFAIFQINSVTTLTLFAIKVNFIIC